MKRCLLQFLRIVLALLATWGAVCVVIAALVHYTGTVEEPGDADVIIVFGAALSKDGTPYKALTRRAAHGARSWKDGRAPAIICTGGVGPHVRVPRSEADGCREVLMREGVPSEAILLDETSRNTDENVRQARDIMARRGWRRAVLVTDSYHAWRASRIARRAGIEVVSSPVPAAAVASPAFYVVSVLREVLAIQWDAWAQHAT